MTRSLNSSTVKFLYSYGGTIVLRERDSVLRYVGGHTRVLAVDSSITFSELMVKFLESCGASMILKCKLPSEDLDVLISVKSDEDLRNVMEEYSRASPEAKIRAVLFPIKSVKDSPPTSPVSCFDFPSAPKQLRSNIPTHECYCRAPPVTPGYRYCYRPGQYQVGHEKNLRREGRSPRHFHHVPQPHQHQHQNWRHCP